MKNTSDGCVAPTSHSAYWHFCSSCHNNEMSPLGRTVTIPKRRQSVAGRRRKKRTQSGGVKCAKQTQFFDCGLRIGHRPPAGRSLRAAGPGAGCTNKPNWEARSCETKPNLGRMGDLGDGALETLLCKTKPICREENMRISVCHTRD
jgi:hypothetical protein